jgi:hypothetical protein
MSICLVLSVIYRTYGAEGSTVVHGSVRTIGMTALITSCEKEILTGMSPNDTWPYKTQSRK